VSSGAVAVDRFGTGVHVASSSVRSQPYLTSAVSGLITALLLTPEPAQGLWENCAAMIAIVSALPEHEFRVVLHK